MIVLSQHDLPANRKVHEELAPKMNSKWNRISTGATQACRSFSFFLFLMLGLKKKRKMNRRKIMIKNIAIEKVKVNNKKATELKIMR